MEKQMAKTTVASILMDGDLRTSPALTNELDKAKADIKRLDDDIKNINDNIDDMNNSFFARLALLKRKQNFCFEEVMKYGRIIIALEILDVLFSVLNLVG